MLSPLNFFAPYKDLPGKHENQLTRALLVVLRYSSLAHAAWLLLVDSRLRLESLSAPVFRTQEARLAGGDTSELDTPIRGLSVLLAPNPVEISAEVQVTDRNQVLDGIVAYGQDLIVAIENKITQGVHERQVVHINTHGANVCFDKKVRVVAWQRLLEVFADLVTRELVFGAERKLLEDFLAFADHHFPQVGPYSTLRRAGTSDDRIKQRLDAVLADAVGMLDRTGRVCWRDLPERADRKQRAVEMVYLGAEPETSRIVLELYPGDTLQQARMLYARPAAVRELLSLPGWTSRPNFHWGLRSSGLCWTPGALDAARYVEYWIERIAQTGRVERANWEPAWASLESHGIVRPQDKADFDRRFTRTQIQTATPRPGLACQTAWTLEEAASLDDGGKFVPAVRERIAQLLDLVGDGTVAAVIRSAEAASDH